MTVVQLKTSLAFHVDVPVFKDVTQSKEIKDVCKQLGLKAPIIPQSMVIFKSEKIGGAVGPHKVRIESHLNPYITCRVVTDRLVIN